MPRGQFRWREPGTKRPCEIEEIDNLEIIPRVGEKIHLQSEANVFHSFPFIGHFIVEEVTYRIKSSPVTSTNPSEAWQIRADEQEVIMDVQPLDRSSWNIVQKIAKEFGGSRKRADE